MLTLLSLRDFILVQQLDLSFSPGFTVLTGETGAGKSILIEALALLLGERADANVVRGGTTRCEISAEFDLSRLPETRAWLDENDLADGDGCVMRRVIEANGRSRAYINGRLATLQQLRELAAALVEILGQHAHQTLLQTKTQREILDHYGNLTSLAVEVGEKYKAWQNSLSKLHEWEANASELNRERAELEWQVQELQNLNLNESEWEELQQEHSRLNHAASLLEGGTLAMAILSEGDAAVSEQLSRLISRFRALAEFDATLLPIVESLANAEIHINDAEHTLKQYLQRLDLDPARLADCEAKIERVHTLARKYRTREVDLPKLYQEKKARLAALQTEGSAEALSISAAQAKADYFSAAQTLSRKRLFAAKKLSSAVSALMQDLAMTGGRFEVRLNPITEGASFGLEQVEFLVCVHKSMGLNPISKVASGGELSRLSLALHVAASDAAQASCLIFDEVDVGIGGGVAEIVGSLLKKLARDRQVLCITHLPQVAAQGDTHWQVSKNTANGEVISEVQILNKQQRIDEIARMLGGIEITETTRKHAAEMLGLNPMR